MPGSAAKTGKGGVNIQARVDPTLGDASKLYVLLEKQWFPALEAQFPGLSARTGQQRQEQQAMLAAFGEYTVMTLLLIYVLIAVPFRSYSKPLIFLLAAPVAWSGGVLAHWVFGLPLSMESMVGMVAASGVVVNDSGVIRHHRLTRYKPDRKRCCTHSQINAYPVRSRASVFVPQ